MATSLLSNKLPYILSRNHSGEKQDRGVQIGNIKSVKLAMHFHFALKLRRTILFDFLVIAFNSMNNCGRLEHKNQRNFVEDPSYSLLPKILSSIPFTI